MKNRYLGIIMILSFSALGQTQDLITDRPDFTESPFVVLPNMIQIEGGAEFKDLQSMTDLSYPIVLARIGLGANLEVRVGFSGWSTISAHDEKNTYVNDMLVEAKYQLTKVDAAIPMALLVVSTLPTGDEQITADATEIGFKYACSYDINDRIGLGANIGAISMGASDNRSILSLASVAMGVAIDDRAGAFVELLAEMPQHETWQPVIDGGLTYLITPTAQADLYVGKGLNSNAANWIIGCGFSFRFAF